MLCGLVLCCVWILWFFPLFLFFLFLFLLRFFFFPCLQFIKCVCVLGWMCFGWIVAYYVEFTNMTVIVWLCQPGLSREPRLVFQTRRGNVSTSEEVRHANLFLREKMRRQTWKICTRRGLPTWLTWTRVVSPPTPCHPSACDNPVLSHPPTRARTVGMVFGFWFCWHTDSPPITSRTLIFGFWFVKPPLN